MKGTDQAPVAPAGQPVRSRSVTHRVTRRRRIVANVAATADSPPAVTEAEPDTTDTDITDADTDTTEIETTDADVDTTDADAADSDAKDAEQATSMAKRKRRRRSDPMDRRRSTRAQRERRWRITSAVLVLLLVASMVAVTLVGVRWNERRETSDGLREAHAAGRQLAVNFMSLTVSTVDRDIQRIIDGATGDFKQEYERNKSMFRTQIIENKAESTCTVLRSAILSGDRDSAVILVALDATIKNAKAPDGRLSHYRIQLDVARDGGSGRWLVSRLQFVG